MLQSKKMLQIINKKNNHKSVYLLHGGGAKPRTGLEWVVEEESAWGEEK